MPSGGAARSLFAAPGLGTFSSRVLWLAYLDNQWQPLSACFDDAELEIHNNACNAARGITGVMPRPGPCRVGAEMAVTSGRSATEVHADAA